MLLPFLAISAKFIILIHHAERVSQFITARVKLIYTSIMVVSQSIRKKARSGRAVRFEPQDLELINEDPTIRVSFEQTRCMCFCERIVEGVGKREESLNSFLVVYYVSL
jgi:hypothetical protein